LYKKPCFQGYKQLQWTTLQPFDAKVTMPIYAYKCASCGHAKDVLQKISDAPLTECPACGKATFSKQITAAGFQLKGSGWYVTDFRGGSGGTSAAATGAAAAGATASAESSASTADAAPAAGCGGSCACHPSSS
jgi:putative FmdB family regulatory protein